MPWAGWWCYTDATLAQARDSHYPGHSTDERQYSSAYEQGLMTANLPSLEYEFGSITGSGSVEGSRRQALDPQVLETHWHSAQFVSPCCRTVPDVAAAKVAQGPVKLMYDSQEHFEQITGQLKMLREWKDGECHPWRVAGCSMQATACCLWLKSTAVCHQANLLNCLRNYTPLFATRRRAYVQACPGLGTMEL